MKILMCVCFTLGFIACQGNTQQKVELKTQLDSVSYTIGMSIGKNFKHQLVEINPDVLIQAIKDVLGGNKTILTDEQAQAIMMAFQNELAAKQEAKNRELAEKNKKDGEAFLVENKKREGVVTTGSGLQYKVLKEGNGPKPKAESTVSVHYRGTLIDGTEFDSSFKRGEPATFPVGGVIRGWTEALQLMPVGSKWQLFIPSELAYGERGTGGVIGPNAVLIFEVELLGIE